VVLSFKEEAKDFLDKLFRDNQVKKKYYAIVKGILPGKETIWEDRLETKKGSSLRTIRSQRGVSSKTMVKVIRTSRKLPIPVTLVEMQPLTGRTHQLRVQSALRNCPILGDKTYGDFKFNRLMEKVLRIDRLCLHARETVLPRKGQSPLSIFAKADFEALV
jgi:23S rRNA-/tRNA-specific pseudouridylate synthase